MSSETIEHKIRAKLITLYAAPADSQLTWLLAKWRRDNPSAFRDDIWWDRDYVFTL